MGVGSALGIGSGGGVAGAVGVGAAGGAAAWEGAEVGAASGTTFASEQPESTPSSVNVAAEPTTHLCLTRPGSSLFIHGRVS